MNLTLLLVHVIVIVFSVLFAVGIALIVEMKMPQRAYSRIRSAWIYLKRLLWGNKPKNEFTLPEESTRNQQEQTAASDCFPERTTVAKQMWKVQAGNVKLALAVLVAFTTNTSISWGNS